MKLDIDKETTELQVFTDPETGLLRTAWVPRERQYGDLHVDQPQEWRSSGDLIKRALDPKDYEYTVRVQLIVERAGPLTLKNPEYCSLVSQLTSLPNELHPRRNPTEV